MNDRKEGTKLWVAKQLYRWQLSSGILSIIFSALTFLGVFVLVLGPLLQTLFGFSYFETALMLMAFVVILIFGFGFFLDHGIKFWSAQATVGTVRNQYLVDALYQKELLRTKYNDLPQLYAFKVQLHSLPPTPEREAVLEQLERAIVKMEQTVREHKWTIEPNERVY